MKKRIISLVLSVVTLVACFVVNARNTASLIVGPGSGVDEPFESAEDLSDFLAFVAERDASNIGGAYKLLANELAYDEDEDEENSEKKRSKYESATISISTHINASSSSSNSDYSGGMISLDQNVNRQLDIYITEDETFYVSKGVFSISRVYSSSSSSDLVNFNIEIYMEDDEVYLMFHDFLYVEQSERTNDGEEIKYQMSQRIKPSMKDRWIEVTSMIAASFLEIDSENREVMQSLKEMLDFLDECDALDENTGYTELNSDELNDLYKEWAEENDPGSADKDMIPEDTEVKLTVDLSNATNPYISVVNVMDYDETEKYTNYDDAYNPYEESVRITRKINRVEEINIRNVNNTVINMDTSNISLSVDEDDFEDDLFIKKETDDD